MRTIGFSTGALAKGNVIRGEELQAHTDVSAVEVSALRERELEPTMRALKDLDLSRYRYVSMHVPSELPTMSERELVEHLSSLAGVDSFVVHPNIIRDFDAWHALGERMCIENMDQRKRVGRTAGELRPFFDEFPSAGFCLDLGHAHQIDPTMGVAMELLDEFEGKLRHLHVSEVNPYGRHIPVGYTARHAFERVAGLIPAQVPIIIESVLEPHAVATELGLICGIFTFNAYQKAS
jgi:Xylose isomerase-like TIM barrel